MKTAIICPVPDLERFVGDTTTHLLLAQRFTPPMDMRYQQFYAERSRRGDYVILDNGAYKTDGGRAHPMSELLRIAQLVRASEVVCPDVIERGGQTLHKTQMSMRYLETPDGEEAYRAAGHPNLMIVPQGHDLGEWEYCLKHLQEAVSQTMVKLGSEDPDRVTIGVSKVYGPDIIRRLELIEKLGFHDWCEVHLLGWAGPFETFEFVAERWSWIRSVDSARPITYGKAGRPLEQDKPHISRDADFFEDSVPVQMRDLVERNIQVWRELAGDVD